MLLRRRGDLELVMAQLGGELFAIGGDVDQYFPDEDEQKQPYLVWDQGTNAIPLGSVNELLRGIGSQPAGPERVIDTDRVKNRIQIHLRFAAEREASELLRWSYGYTDGLERALRTHKQEPPVWLKNVIMFVCGALFVLVGWYFGLRIELW